MAIRYVVEKDVIFLGMQWVYVDGKGYPNLWSSKGNRFML
jgi:hypothetical protein